MYTRCGRTDITYFRIIHWGGYYLSTVLDDFTHYINAWKLGPTMDATDVTEPLRDALESRLRPLSETTSGVQLAARTSKPM